jgi:hypothetical protein
LSGFWSHEATPSPVTGLRFVTSCLVREALRGVTLFSGVPNRRVKESEWEDLRGPDEFLTLGGVHITLKISLDGLRTLEAKETVMQA